jgi:hypothetical protein
LDEVADIHVVGVGQQIGRLAVIDSAVGREAIRNRGEYDQAKRLQSGTSLPQDILNFLVTDFAVFSADEKLSVSIGYGFVLADRFWSEFLIGIPFSWVSRIVGRKTKLGIFPATGQNKASLQRGLEDLAITKPAIQREEKDACERPCCIKGFA